MSTTALRNRSWIIAWLLGSGVFFLVAFTAADYGVTWDEPAYFYASDLHTRWLAGFGRNLLNGRIGESLNDDAIKAAWHWDPYHVPHPPFSRIVSGLTKAAFYPFVDKFVAYRLGPAIFLALLVGVMYLWMAEVFDPVTGLVSALAVMLIPNLFGFAHLAVTDMPLAAMWFLTVYCFWKGLNDWRWSVAVGVVWGLALSTKFPAFLIPIPLLLWAHLYYRRSYGNNLFCMIFLGPAVMIATQPYLWHQTSLRILEFLYEGLSRGYRPDASFPIFFLNRLYFTSDLPLYYPFFLTTVTIPETIIALSAIGILALLRAGPENKVTMLFLLNVLFILVLGLLPGAVLHDGIRQLLSLLPFMVGLSGAGFYILAKVLTEGGQKIKSLHGIRNFELKLVSALLALLLFPPALDLILYHPFELSYYNRFIGGIRGAYQRGLEATYFMEAFTPAFLRFLNERLPAQARIYASFSNSMFQYYQREGRLRQDLRIIEKGDFDYFILLNRRSVLSEKGRSLIRENQKPYASVALADVPLVLVYHATNENEATGQ